MKLEELLQGLQHSQATARLCTVNILAMVEETLALVALKQRFAIEPDAQVKQAIAQAGTIIHQAKRRGYSTLDEIFRYFKIDREIENMEDPEEARAIQRMQDQFEIDLRKEKTDNMAGNIGTAAAIGLVTGGVVGGAMMAAGAAVGGTAGVTSSNVGQETMLMGKKRTPPQIPANADISLWAQRLREDDSAESRQRAALELRNLHNPAALTVLADAFVSDPVASMREAAQQQGKFLYWGCVYWHWTQDGTIQKEVIRRIDASGKFSNKASGQPQQEKGSMKESSPEELAEILRRAQERKAKKRR